MKTPTEICADRIRDLEAQLALADERHFYLAAENALLRSGLSDKGGEIFGFPMRTIGKAHLPHGIAGAFGDPSAPEKMVFLLHENTHAKQSTP